MIAVLIVSHTTVEITDVYITRQNIIGEVQSLGSSSAAIIKGKFVQPALTDVKAWPSY